MFLRFAQSQQRIVELRSESCDRYHHVFVVVASKEGHNTVSHVGARGGGIILNVIILLRLQNFRPPLDDEQVAPEPYRLIY